MAPNYRSLVPGGFFSATPFDRSIPVSIRCNNPGAINGASWEQRCPGYVDTVETTPGNKTTIFEAPEYGVAVWWELLRRYAAANVRTVGGIINRYGGGQDYSNYIKFVAKMTGFDEQKEIQLDDDVVLLAFGKAMFHYEAGRENPLSDEQILYGLGLGRSDGIVADIAAAALAGVQPQDVTAFVAKKRSIIVIANQEFDTYHGINEGNEPLRTRIADYYEAGGGSRDLDPTRDENAWSAAFISFCVKQSGATASQFKFNLLHSVYVKEAIANADANRGVFRAHPFRDYAPKLGDIIHHNRSGGTIDFEFARAHSGYPSHCVIVVDFEVRSGVRGVVTIGGNEFLQGGTGTVGKKFLPVDSSGLLNQSAIGPRLICVIENLLAAGATPVAAPLGPYVVNVRTDLTLRGGPGTGFVALQSLSNGTRLNVLAFEDNASGLWALVDLVGDGRKDGYVFAAFIEPVVA